MVIPRLAQLLRQITLPGGIGVGFVMRVAITLAVSQFFHQRGGRIAQVQRNRQRAMLGHLGPSPVEGHINRIALGRAGQINSRLRQR